MTNGGRRKFHPVYLVLALPYVAFFAVPFYNRITPEFLGIPFFYWWQILWVIGTAVCIVPVYLHEESRRK